MIENLTRLGVDLGGPTLVAYAVVAVVAGLTGVAVGSLLELLRTRQLARPGLYDLATSDLLTDDPSSFDAPPVPARAPSAAAAPLAPTRPALPSRQPEGLAPDTFSEPGVEGWFSSAPS
jgi:hypothetical protein